MPPTPATDSIFRIDKFIVPAPARAEFLEKVSLTDDLLGSMDGCLQNRVLEQTSGPGVFNFVTIVEWDNIASIEKARAAVAEMHRAKNINPQELFTRLGITADMASYEGPKISGNATTSG